MELWTSRTRPITAQLYNAEDVDIYSPKAGGYHVNSCTLITGQKAAAESNKFMVSFLLLWTNACKYGNKGKDERIFEKINRTDRTGSMTGPGMLHYLLQILLYGERIVRWCHCVDPESFTKGDQV